MFTVVLAVLGSVSVCAGEAPAVSAQAAIVMHADTGTVLYEKQAEQPMLIASTTKIMTAVVALEHCDPDQEVTIRPEWTNIEGSSMYLKAGGIYTLRELLYGMMLSSGNDAATAVACTAAGSEDVFVQWMNEKAKDLGMTNTSFENPHGLDGENHYSSARDLAVLAAYAMENDEFSAIVSTRSITIGDQTYGNHNKLLWQCEGVIGVKTGYTKAAGRTLVSCCERDGTRYLCVTLNDPQDWNDHKSLLEWAFGEASYVSVIDGEKGISLPVICEDGGEITVAPEENVQVLVRPGDRVEWTAELPRFVFPGIQKGDPAGWLLVTVNGTVQKEVQLIYQEDLPIPGSRERAI